MPPPPPLSSTAATSPPAAADGPTFAPPTACAAAPAALLSPPAPPPPAPPATRGLLLVFLSTFLFSAMNVAINAIARGPPPVTPVLQAVVVRFVLQVALSAAAIAALRRGRLRAGATWLGRRENRARIFWRGAWGIGGLVGWFATLSSLSLSDATAIVYVNVPLAAIFAALLLGEPYGAADAATAALAGAGVLLVAQPASLFGGAGGGGAPVPAGAVAVALAGAVCSAMAFVSARRIGPGEDTLVVVLLFAALGCVVTPLLAAATGAWGVVATPRDAALMVAAGVTGWAGQLLLNGGMQTAPAGPAAIMRYADLVLAIAYQAAVLGEPPNALKLVGSALVMSTVASTVLRERARARAKEAARAAGEGGGARAQGAADTASGAAALSGPGAAAEELDWEGWGPPPPGQMK